MEELNIGDLCVTIRGDLVEIYDIFHNTPSATLFMVICKKTKEKFLAERRTLTLATLRAKGVHNKIMSLQHKIDELREVLKEEFEYEQ